MKYKCMQKHLFVEEAKMNKNEGKLYLYQEDDSAMS